MHMIFLAKWVIVGSIFQTKPIVFQRALVKNTSDVSEEFPCHVVKVEWDHESCYVLILGPFLIERAG